MRGIRGKGAAIGLAAALAGVPATAFAQLPFPNLFGPREEPQRPAQERPLDLQPPASRQPALPRLAPFQAPPAQPPPGTATQPAPLDFGTSLRLTALYATGGASIQRGVVWRVYATRADAPGGVRLVAESADAQPVFRLPPGVYMVNAAYGRASLTRRLTLTGVPISDVFPLDAGGLRLSSSVADRRLGDQGVTYTILAGAGPGGAPVLENVRGNRIIRLPVGQYHVISRYGDANATMNGDVRVQPGRVTDVTLHHRAARVTLKLVNERGGEAIADTAWTVLTPGGDTLKESIGAFPSVVLAAGDYTVIARNDGRVFNARFTVEIGRDRDVEVLTR
jgi:hypothetical protein